MTTRKSRAKQKRVAASTASLPADAARHASSRRAPAAAPVTAASREWTIAQRVIPLLVLVIAGLIAYANSFNGAFVYDDQPRIVNNPQIKQLSPLWAVMAHASRPLVELSLAINYTLSGLDVWGYHAFNWSIHVLAALTLFGVVRRMLQSPRLAARYGPVASWLAMAVALLWLLHPLQTESVTYVIQRAESMVGLFLLLMLYCAIRGAQSPNPGRWYLAAVVASAMGMASKEVMVVAPIIMLLYDRLFIASSFKEIFRRRSGLYAGLAATWLIVFIAVATSRVEDTTGVQRTVDAAWRYALTQFGVIVHYLRLSLWPHPLVIEYSWPLADSVADALPWAAIVIVLVALTVWGLVRQHWLAFWGAWFFVILAPTSTILPIADPAFEHRMYLPLASVVVLMVIGVYELIQRSLRSVGMGNAVRHGAGLLLLVPVASALGAATFYRNEAYRSELALWSDVVAKRPESARGQFSLGVLLSKQGKIRESIAPLSRAVALKPDAAEAHSELGASLYRDGRKEEGLEHLFQGVRLRPDFADGRNNLAVALYLEGRMDEAIEQYRAALSANPRSAAAHQNLGLALMHRGNDTAAIAELESALRIKPDYPDAHNNLGKALLRQGRNKEARTHFAEAVRLQPDFAEARNNLRAVEAAERAGRP